MSSRGLILTLPSKHAHLGLCDGTRFRLLIEGHRLRSIKLWLFVATDISRFGFGDTMGKWHCLIDAGVADLEKSRRLFLAMLAVLWWTPLEDRINTNSVSAVHLKRLEMWNEFLWYPSVRDNTIEVHGQLKRTPFSDQERRTLWGLLRVCSCSCLCRSV